MSGHICDAKKKSEFPSVTNDRILRLGHLPGIKKNLEILFPCNPVVRANWLRIKRDAFKGKSALELIKEGSFESMNRLFTVRRMLDVLRSGAINELKCEGIIFASVRQPGGINYGLFG